MTTPRDIASARMEKWPGETYAIACDLLVKGEIAREFSWIVAHHVGTCEENREVSIGNAAPIEEIRRRRERCRACRHATPISHGDVTNPLGWCGRAGVRTGSTTGRLLAATTCVASHDCPDGKWCVTAPDRD